MSDCFDNKKIVKLLNYNKNDYVIDLMFNAKSPHNLFYFFFEKKLNVLQNYLHNNKKSNKIKRFTNFAKAFIMFITKKNKNFRLCVDYRDLNVITIKNRYFLFFINKTLNRLINAQYFTKLNFKNIYYRIRIRVKNK